MRAHVFFSLLLVCVFCVVLNVHVVISSCLHTHAFFVMCVAISMLLFMFCFTVLETVFKINDAFHLTF